MPVLGVIGYNTDLTKAITRCPLCEKLEEIDVTKEEVITYNEGALIQDAFPYLDADKREQLLTGYCPQCWDELFKEYDEEE